MKNKKARAELNYCVKCAHYYNDELAVCDEGKPIYSPHHNSQDRQGHDPADQERLRKLEKQATPAPWEVTGWEAGSHGHNHDTVCIGGPNHRAPDYFLTGDIRDTPQRKANHNFIVALRNAYPGMARELADLRREVERLRITAHEERQ